VLKGDKEMCTVQQLEDIKSQMISAYRNVYGDSIVRIMLYGSYARGDYDSNSDIDFTAIAYGNRRELQDKLKIVWDVSADIGLENDVVISPTVIPADEFEQYKSRLPYYRNIDQEGLCIG
jgi:predicted nucleotidyltransferase